MQPFSFFLLAIRWGGGISGRVRALNLTVPLGSGRVGSDNLGYGPCSGFSFEPVQTSSALRGGINNFYFGHRHAVGKLHNTVWFYSLVLQFWFYHRFFRWSFPSHFPSHLNTLLMPVRILLSLSFQVNCLSITYNDTFSAINMGL